MDENTQGEFKAELRVALLSAYDLAEFERMLSDCLGLDLEHIAPKAGNLRDAVDAVIEHCEQSGRLDELVLSALSLRRRNAELRAFLYKHYVRTVVRPARPGQDGEMKGQGMSSNPDMDLLRGAIADITRALQGDKYLNTPGLIQRLEKLSAELAAYTAADAQWKVDTQQRIRILEAAQAQQLEQVEAAQTERRRLWLVTSGALLAVALELALRLFGG